MVLSVRQLLDPALIYKPLNIEKTNCTTDRSPHGSRVIPIYFRVKGQGHRRPLLSMLQLDIRVTLCPQTVSICPSIRKSTVRCPSCNFINAKDRKVSSDVNAILELVYSQTTSTKETLSGSGSGDVYSSDHKMIWIS